jgi:hypothetical protein
MAIGKQMEINHLMTHAVERSTYRINLGGEKLYIGESHHLIMKSLIASSFLSAEQIEALHQLSYIGGLGETTAGYALGAAMITSGLGSTILLIPAAMFFAAAATAAAPLLLPLISLFTQGRILPPEDSVTTSPRPGHSPAGAGSGAGAGAGSGTSTFLKAVAPFASHHASSNTGPDFTAFPRAQRTKLKERLTRQLSSCLGKNPKKIDAIVKAAVNHLIEDRVVLPEQREATEARFKIFTRPRHNQAFVTACCSLEIDKLCQAREPFDSVESAPRR